MNQSGLGPEDAEMIAAFIDQRLPDDERLEFLKRLDEDEALYEVFVETVRYREQAEKGSATVAEHPAGRANRWLVPAAIAAVLALAVATPLLLRVGRTPSSAQLADSLVDATESAALVSDTEFGPWYEQGWSVTRGLTPNTTGADTAFRIGVRVVDLDVAIRLDRRDEATILTHRLDALLSQIDELSLLQASYAGVRQMLETSETPEDLLAVTATTGPLVGELFPELRHAYTFGQWAEAGKLACKSGNRPLLGARFFRRVVPYLQKHRWTVEVADHLAVIGDLLSAPEGELDLGALEERFTQVINES